MSEFKIEKGVPIPRGKKYPLDAMEINDSFFVPGAANTALGGVLAPHRPKKFTVRTREENGVKGIRVWRIL